MVDCVPEPTRAVLAGHSLGAMSIAAWAEKHKVNPQVKAAALPHVSTPLERPGVVTEALAELLTLAPERSNA